MLLKIVSRNHQKFLTQKWPMIEIRQWSEIADEQSYRSTEMTDGQKWLRVVHGKKWSMVENVNEHCCTYLNIGHFWSLCRHFEIIYFK